MVHQGPEGNIIFDLMFSGALRHLDNIHFDNLHHDYKLNTMFHEYVNKINEYIEYEKLETKLEHVTEITHQDDETYGEWLADDEHAPLPVC